MGLLDSLLKRFNIRRQSSGETDSISVDENLVNVTDRIAISVSFSSNNQPMTIDDEISDIEFPFVEISTSGDDHVCQMCKQFDRKLFRVSEAPLLPLHPLCGCAYMYHEAAGRRKVWSLSSFVLPAGCTQAFCENASMIEKEKDMERRILLCEEGLLMLSEFLKPYVSSGWDIPEDLPCVYWSIHDYMVTGNWDDTKRVIQICTDAGMYSNDKHKETVNWLQDVSEASAMTLDYLRANPGTLQRNIYRKICPPCNREALKWFLSNSMQIRKEKADKTNKLFAVDNSSG